MADVSRGISATAPLAKADRSRIKPAASRTVSRIIPINANNAALLRLMLAVYVYTEDCRAASLETRDFGEVEIAHFHGGYHHVEGLFAGGAHGRGERFHVGEHLDQALIETEVADARGDTAVFHQEGAVTSHAGEDFLVGVHFADVPEARHQDAAFGGGQHFFDG